MKLQTQGKRSCSRGLLIRTSVSSSDDFFLQHSAHSQAKHLQSNSSLAFKKEKYSKAGKLSGKSEFGAGSLQGRFRAALVWSSGAAEAGSPAAVREMKHSYANGISSSLGSVRVGESRAQNLHLHQFPSVRSGRGWMIRCGAAPVLRLSRLLFCPYRSSSLSRLLPPRFYLCIPCLATIKLPLFVPENTGCEIFRVFADSAERWCGVAPS